MFFFFNDTATTEIYTLSLHDALPICTGAVLDRLTTEGALTDAQRQQLAADEAYGTLERLLRTAELAGHDPEQVLTDAVTARSEEHTSELQSRQYLVCRLLLEKKKRHT